jgi:hypothetical protein
LEAARLYGIDGDRVMVTTADDFARVSKPPRPYLQFYYHDLKLPLERCPGLTVGTYGQSVQFDFIFGLNSLIYTPHSQQVLSRLYRQNLKPGGVMYLRDYVHTEGPDGWQAPHPALQPILASCFYLLEGYNPGIVAAEATGQWLEQLGAEHVQSNPDVIPWGGPNQRGKDMMRDIILLAYTSGPSFIESGLMTQQQYNELMRVVYRELTLDYVGQVIHIDNLARKPFK